MLPAALVHTLGACGIAGDLHKLHLALFRERERAREVELGVRDLARAALRADSNEVQVMIDALRKIAGIGAEAGGSESVMCCGCGTTLDASLVTRESGWRFGTWTGDGEPRWICPGCLRGLE